MASKDPGEGRRPVTVALDQPVPPAADAGPGRSLLETADELGERLPGIRVEIIAGVLIVTPPSDLAHALALTDVTAALIRAGLDRGATRVVQAAGLWGSRADGYAVPDLAVIDAGFEAHHVQRNCYEAAVFRMVLEVTSRNRGVDLVTKREEYAALGIPVYVIADRKAEMVFVLTGPDGDDYRHEAAYRRGETFILPPTIGAAVELRVDLALGPQWTTGVA
jgi:Uma2 family endonuclease